MNLDDFIRQHKITAIAKEADNNPYIEADAAWKRSARHWRITLAFSHNPITGGQRKLTVPFSQGEAHTQPPTAADVLSCLASDAASIENARNFEEWANEYGYNTDSRTAERIYKNCQEQSDDLAGWLDDDKLYQTLLYKTERL